MEIAMEHVVIGTKLVPISRIALVEPFDAGRNRDFQSTKDYKARVVLITGGSHLAELLTPEKFTEDHRFRWLSKDKVAINPAIEFSVEKFVRTENSNIKEQYETSLKWIGPDGKPKAKFLFEESQNVLEVVYREEPESAPGQENPSEGRSRRPATTRRRKPLTPEA
jgi:hypothetical protein